MADKVYPKGLFTFAKNEKAPDFVLGSLVITLDDFKAWLNGDGKQWLTDYQGKKQLRLSILKGRDGKVNFEVDTYRKGDASAKPQQSTNNQPSQDDDLGLPF
jgi:hypothetical protein